MDNENGTNDPNGGGERGRKPDIVLREGALRSATWLTEGDYELLSSTLYTRSYRDKDGEFQETPRMRQQDQLPLMELVRDTRSQIKDRDIEYKRSLNQDRKGSTRDEREKPRNLEQSERLHDEDKSRSDIARERFKDDRQSRGTRRRSKPRDRSAR